MQIPWAERRPLKLVYCHLPCMRIPRRRARLRIRNTPIWAMVSNKRLLITMAPPHLDPHLKHSPSSSRLLALQA